MLIDFEVLQLEEQLELLEDDGALTGRLEEALEILKEENEELDNQ